ncbi:MAG: DUF1552 domain-containing protein [Acidobacteria bacterium]|nr:DUF1552 domain-containing protein [Acidobacteriota bacterium]MDA1234878.1 DUF1552 domain-containing protein [Acidobacteriota bacterium]
MANILKKRGISRRTVLRGAGVAMSLPWLEAMAPGATSMPAEFPKRFGVLFMGMGVHEDHWSASGQGADMVLSKTLEPLEPIKQKINVVDGLFNKNATGQGIHPAQTGNLLSGVHFDKGAIIHSGISVDQVIANHVGEDTPQSSIVLSCEQPMTGFHETNFSLAYSSHISWQNPDSPVPVEVYPSLAFDNLFENRSSLRNTSILDRVKDRAESLGTQISASDRTKLDEYMTSVREVERRVETMRKNMDKAEDKAKERNTATWTMERPENGLPEDLREHSKLLMDIIAMAFQSDRTRVASMLISRDLSAQYYPFLEVSDGHHAASHNNNSDAYERVARWHVSQLAYLAQKLDSMPEGDSTVLDNSCIMFLSNLWIGRLHDNSRLPVILAGGMGGDLRTGRTLNYLGKPDEERKMCSLYLSLMDRMGVSMDGFGDATTRLEDI